MILEFFIYFLAGNVGGICERQWNRKIIYVMKWKQ